MPDIELERRVDVYISNEPYVIGTTPSFTVTLSNIVAGSVSIDRMLAESAISFGSFISDKLELTVYDTDDLSGRAIRVELLDPEYSSEFAYTVFTGVIDSCKLTGNNVDRKIIAYDYAYTWGRVNVADWYNTYWETHTSVDLASFVDALVSDVFNKSVLTISADSEKEFTYPTIEKTVNATSISFAFIMSQISEAGANIYHFTETGDLFRLQRFCTYNYVTYVYDSDIEAENTNFEEYETNDITGVQIEYNGNILASYGDLSNPYIIKDNIFLISKSTQELEDYCEKYYNYIHGSMIYTPCSIKMIVGDPRILHTYEILNRWIYTFWNHKKFPALQQTLSGPLLVDQTLSASGNVDRPQSLTAPEDFTINILRDSVDEVTNEVAQVRVDLNGKVSTEVATQIANTVFEQNVDNFTLSATNGQRSSTLTLSYDGTAIESATIQFTGNVVFASDLTDGTTQISGDNILTGTISAARIDIQDLFAQQITATNLTMAGGSISIPTPGDQYCYVETYVSATGNSSKLFPGDLNIYFQGDLSAQYGPNCEFFDSSGDTKAYIGSGTAKFSGNFVVCDGSDDVITGSPVKILEVNTSSQSTTFKGRVYADHYYEGSDLLENKYALQTSLNAYFKKSNIQYASQSVTCSNNDWTYAFRRSSKFTITSGKAYLTIITATWVRAAATGVRIQQDSSSIIHYNVQAQETSPYEQQASITTQCCDFGDDLYFFGRWYMASTNTLHAWVIQLS